MRGCRGLIRGFCVSKPFASRGWGVTGTDHNWRRATMPFRAAEYADACKRALDLRHLIKTIVIKTIATGEKRCRLVSEALLHSRPLPRLQPLARPRRMRKRATI